METIIPFEFKENKFYIIPKKFDNRNISNHFYEVLNYFCLEENGFEIILKVLNTIDSFEDNNNKSIDQFFPVFSILITFFNHINQFLHFQFASSYLTSIIQTSFSILNKFSLIETRNFKREKFENLIKQLKEIMYRVYIDSDVNAYLDLFGIEFGINCLKNSIILDKKLLGFKVLNDTMAEVAKNCGSNAGFTDRHMPAGLLVDKITNENIFEIIFGPSSHSQILQKSSDFIKSLLMTKTLKSKDFSKLFNISEEATDNETKNTIYKVLISNSINFTVDISYFIINYLIKKKTMFLQTGINTFKITNEDIDLLISSFKALPLIAVKEISKSVGEFLFDIIFYEEDNCNFENNISLSSNSNSNYTTTNNSPNNQNLDKNLNSNINSPCENTIVINNNNHKENYNNNIISILSGLKYEKIIEDFLVLMKSIEFRDYSNKMFEDVLIILKKKKLDDKENFSNKDFIGIVKILRLLMGSYLNILDDSTRSRLLLLIYDEYSILDMLMNFIDQYHKEVTEILNKEKIYNENDNIINFSSNNSVNSKNFTDKNLSINDRIFQVSRNKSHKHSDVVIEIVNFINYMMTSQKIINLTKDQILVLYKIYVEDPIYKSDINIFFKMLKEADNKRAIPQEVFQNVFEMMIISKKLEFSDISLDLFNCLWNFFLIINKNNIILSEGNSKPDTYQSVGPTGQQLYSFSYNNKEEKNEEIRCIINPNELVGFDLIWRLVLSSTINTQVSNVAINNIIKIFFNVSFSNKMDNNTNDKVLSNKNQENNKNQKGYSWGLLIEKCINTINKITDDFNELISLQKENSTHDQTKTTQKTNSLKKQISFSLEEKNKQKKDNETKILNCLYILRVLIEETEKKGTASCISHNSLLKSSLITLKIDNALNVKGGAAYSSSNTNKINNEKSFTLKVYSNTTLWDLKNLISKKINTLPEGIRLNTNNSKDITDKDHGKTLSELNLKDQEKLTVLLSQVFQNIPRYPLTKNGKFTEKTEKTLTDIFFIFANENNLMDQESAARFATVATDSSEPLVLDDCRVKYLFESYDFDKDGFVTLEGFLKFFHDSIEVNRKVDTVWDNIRAFGYRNDLKKFFEPLDEYNNDLGIMPRYSISKNQEYFNTIFKLQDEDEKIAKEASKFLSIISTNPIIYRDILLLKELKDDENNNNKNNEDDHFSTIWLKYIDVNNRYKLLYILQIIESFFEEFDFASGDIDSLPSETAILDDSVKSDLLPNHKIWWIENFLSKGGLELIIQKLYLNINFNEIVSSHFLLKKILNLSTKIIKNSFSFLFRAFNLNKSEIVQFIRKESFGAIDDVAIKNKIINLEENNNKISTESQENEYDGYNYDLNKQISKKLTKDIENLKRDEELLNLLNEKYGDNIINRINFEDISLKLIVFSYIISIKKETEVEERNLFNNSVNLLSLIIISQENIKLFLHNLFTIKEDIKEYIGSNEKIFNQNLLNNINNQEYNLPPTNILTFENFILMGILRNSNTLLCMYFQKCFSNLCTSLEKIKEFSLNVFLTNLFKSIITKISSDEKKTSRYFFYLFSNLIELNTYIDKEEEEVLCFDLMSLIFENSESIPEELLNGYLKILILIVTKRKDLISKIISNYDIVNKIIDTFILKDVEKLKKLLNFNNEKNEKENLRLEFLNTEELKDFFDEKSNTSISGESKKAIFNLLLIMLKDNIENIKYFFSGKFSKVHNYLSSLKKDKKIYNPYMEKRKKDSFIGLRNLHSICYMNSVLQQFFNVPSFKYAILQANDRELPRYDEHFKEIDDNILHQLQRMFIFLENSIRGEFDPNQFCYSFKDFDVKIFM